MAGGDDSRGVTDTAVPGNRQQRREERKTGKRAGKKLFVVACKAFVLRGAFDENLKSLYHAHPSSHHHRRRLRALRALAEAGLEVQPHILAMIRDAHSWDEMEETGLRLCAENPT